MRRALLLFATGALALGGIFDEQLGRLPRGSPLSLRELYKAYGSPTGDFKCGDGSAVLSVARVNDDYCDCSDGSDEPGTPACSHLSHSRFYCLNRGHRGRWLPSAVVDDGICDCCDGSDEGTGLCEDSCSFEAEKHRQVTPFPALSLERFKPPLETRWRLRGSLALRRVPVP